jgi:hypothetical protein
LLCLLFCTFLLLLGSLIMFLLCLLSLIVMTVLWR